MTKTVRKTLGRNPLSTALFHPNETPQFFGETFDPHVDGPRLESQQARVESLMADGFWRTLAGISAELRRRHPGTKDTEASISARLRDMRRRGWTIHRERVHSMSGLYQYRAVKNGVEGPRPETRPLIASIREGASEFAALASGVTEEDRGSAA